MTVYLRMHLSTFAALHLKGCKIHSVTIKSTTAIFALWAATGLVSCSTNAIKVEPNTEPSAVSRLATTRCRVPVVSVSGKTILMTVSEYLSSLNDEFERYNSDENSCDIFTLNASPAVSLFSNSDGAGLDVFFGNHSLLISSEEQYNDCARDIEAAAFDSAGAAVDSCPVLVRPN